jgi:hypothetical protein
VPSYSLVNWISSARFDSVRFVPIGVLLLPLPPVCSELLKLRAGYLAARSDSVSNTSPLRGRRSPLTPAPFRPARPILGWFRSIGTKRPKASSAHPAPGGGRSMAGEKAPRAFPIEELPGHLIGEVLTSGGLAAADLARLEATCRALRPLAEYAASKLCAARAAFAAMGPAARGGLLERCGGSWKKVLRFLQSVEQSSGTVETTSGSVSMLPFFLSLHFTRPYENLIFVSCIFMYSHEIILCFRNIRLTLWTLPTLVTNTCLIMLGLCGKALKEANLKLTEHPCLA